MVVSDMNERLSPKKAPPTTTPTKSGKELPVAVARPAGAKWYIITYWRL